MFGPCTFRLAAPSQRFSQAMQQNLKEAELHFQSPVFGQGDKPLI